LVLAGVQSGDVCGIDRYSEWSKELGIPHGGDAFRAAHGEIFATFSKIHPFLSELRAASGEGNICEHMEKVVLAVPDAEGLLSRRRAALRAAAKARAEEKTRASSRTLFQVGLPPESRDLISRLPRPPASVPVAVAGNGSRFTTPFCASHSDIGTIDGETPAPINPTAYALAIFRFLVGA